MPIFSVDDIRKSWGGSWANASDESLVDAYSRQIGQDPAEVAIQLGLYPGSGGKNAKRLSASVDRYQSNLYGLGEAVSNKFGLDRVGGWMGERRRANELEANVASQRAREMGAIESFRDIGGVGDALDYAVGLGIQSAPYLGEALVGGLGARAAMGGTRAALGAATQAGDAAAAAQAANRLRAGQTIGGTTATYPSAVGDILSNQREQADVTDLGSAAALGIPYAALNALGLEGAVMRGRLARSGIDALDNISGIRGGLARAGATGARTALVEGSTETGQEGLNQLGRMAVDPYETFLNPRSMERFEESFVGGATLGGLGGAGLGGWRRSAPPQPVNLLPGANTNFPSNIDDLNRLPDTAAVGAQGDLFTSEQAPPNQFSAFPRAVNDTVPVDQLNDLLDQRGILLTLMQRAEQAGDAKAFYAAQSALNQLTPQIDALQQQVDRATAGDYQRQMSLPFGRPILRSQMDLFGGPDVPNGMEPTAPDSQVPAMDTVGGTGPVVEEDLFTEKVPQDARRSESRAVLRRANGGRWNKSIEKIVGFIEQKDWAGLDRFIQTSSANPRLLDTALELSAAYQQQDMNVLAQEGMRRARPGAVVGSTPVSNATEMEMRAANTVPTPPADVAPVPTLDEQIADTDARVQGGQQQRTAAARREVLDGVLQGAANVGNARNRFIKALRKSGFRDTMITPDEQAAINRHFDVTEAFVGQDPDVLPSAPNEMGNAVPEKQEKPPQKGKPKRTNENKSFRLTSPPSTDEDLAALEKANAKRERKAGTQEEPEAEPEDTRPVRQGELFTKKGEPTAKADQQPEKRKPRKAKVKAEVGGQQIELEVDNADEKIAAMRADIDKYKAFVACLRKK